jgi:hypothetical protein
VQIPQRPSEYAKEAFYLGVLGAAFSGLLLALSPTLGVVGFVITGIVVVGLLAIAGVAKAVEIGVRSADQD